MLLLAGVDLHEQPASLLPLTWQGEWWSFLSKVLSRYLVFCLLVSESYSWRRMQAKRIVDALKNGGLVPGITSPHSTQPACGLRQKLDW